MNMTIGPRATSIRSRAKPLRNGRCLRSRPGFANTWLVGDIVNGTATVAEESLVAALERAKVGQVPQLPLAGR